MDFIAFYEIQNDALGMGGDDLIQTPADHFNCTRCFAYVDHRFLGGNPATQVCNDC